ncbi:MAG TPA: cardiolipin synthase [Prolixibacteraceae bacterium]|jgi:cardiolipin synthase|nr:cardiolipin synthase [Prolixibacteraceae bacterium]
MGILFGIWGAMPNLVTVLYFLTVIFIAVLIILENRNPVKTISWILVLVLLPFIGIVIYLFFGQEYRKTKMYSRKGLKNLEKLRKLTLVQLDNLPKNHFQINDRLYSKKRLINLLLSNSNSILTNDNEVKVLRNGEETFPEIFRAIQQARHHIHLEFYIVEDDVIGNYLRELLIQKALEGVEVRFIYDDVGSWQLKKKFIRSMSEAGVKVDCFMRVRFPNLTSRVNYRNHRKILVVDGDTAFVGGLNFADRYQNGVPGIGPWRDTHLKLVGGGATALQIIFMADWYFVSKEILRGENYFKPFVAGSGKLVQVTASGPDSDWESIGQAYFLAIATANDCVYLSTPYLMPTPDIMTALKTSALGGVDVRIIVPGLSDAITAKWGTNSFIQELLEAGVKIYFYKGGFIHSKIIVVDSVFSSVGTANLDFRSLETNFEVNAMIYDEEIAETLTAQFLEDQSRSDEIVLREWMKRPRINKIKESFARILSPML